LTGTGTGSSIVIVKAIMVKKKIELKTTNDKNDIIKTHMFSKHGSQAVCRF
jgi:hypothetical protein